MTTAEETLAAEAAKGGGGTTPAGTNAEATAAAKPVVPATPDPAAEPKEQMVPLTRLQTVIAQRAEEQRTAEALRRELKLANDTLEEFRALGSKAPAQDGSTPAGTRATPAPKPLSQEELQRLVTEEGARQVFNQRCNDAVAEGRKAHTDFDKIVLGDLTSLSPVLDRNTGRPTLPVPLIEAALETGNAQEVLYALGQDASEASRIMALPPIKQAVELAKFATKMSEPKGDAAAAAELPNVSKAPAPIRTTVPKGPTKPSWNEYDTEHFSTDEWIKQREKQVRESREASRR